MDDWLRLEVGEVEAESQSNPTKIIEDIQTWMESGQPVLLNGKEKEELQKGLATLAEEINVRWLPEYGSAIVMKKIRQGTLIQLTLVGLDNWEQCVKRNQSGDFISVARNPQGVFIPISQIPVADLEDLLACFNDLLKIAQQRTGNKRSAAKKEQGHQKTPGFIMAIMTQALETFHTDDTDDDECKEHEPFGGFTDVGMHTGMNKRSCTWPLLVAVLQHELEGSVHDVEQVAVLLQKLFVDMLHSFASKAVKDIRAEYSYSTEVLCRKAVERIAVELHRNRSKSFVRDGTAFLAELAKHLGETIRKVRLKSTNPFQVVLETSRQDFSAGLDDSRIPLCTSVARDEDSTSGESDSDNQDTRDEAAAAELGCFETNDSFLTLFDLEEYFWALVLDDDVLEQGCSTSPESCINSSKHYSEVSKNLQVSEFCRPEPEQYSIRVLIRWISYCVAHKYATAQHPALMGFKPALNWKDLSSLVLSSRRAQQSLKRVIKYLHSVEKSAPSGRVFVGTTDMESTLEFGCRLADLDKGIQSAWREVKKHTNSILKSKWQEVERKRRNLKELEEEMDRISSQLRQANSELVEANLRRTLNHLKRRCDEEGKIPPRHQIWVPFDDKKGMGALALYSLPKPLQLLCCAGFDAQKELVEGKSGPIDLKTGVEPPIICLQKALETSVKTGKDLCFGTSFSHVNWVSKKEDLLKAVRQIIVLPKGVEEDPFGQSRRPDEGFVFTLEESRPPDEGPDEGLDSWIMVNPKSASDQSEEARVRGNKGIAEPKEQSEMTKEVYQALCALRADPLQQLRKVFTGLESFADVKYYLELVMLALFQCGPWSARIDGFEWRQDVLETPKEAHVLLHEALDRWQHIFKENTAKLAALATCSVVAGYMSQFEPDRFFPVLDSLARSAVRRAKEINSQIQKSKHSPREEKSLENEKQRVLRNGALGFQYLPVSMDFGSLVEIAALANTGGDKMETHTEWIEFLLARVPSESIQGRHLSRYVQALGFDPEPFTWVKCDASHWLWRGRDGRGQVFHVCLLNGKYLVNGNPPGRLPRPIISTPYYKRSFGKYQFLVEETAPGTFTTQHEDLGFRFRFSRNFISEIHAENHSELRLLDIADLKHSDVFPLYVVEPCSAWYSPSTNFTFFRHLKFRDRRVLYVMSPTGKLYDVPDHLEEEDNTTLIKLHVSFPQLVTEEEPNSCPILRLLSKFEPAEFVLVTYLRESNSREFTLLRYGLRFSHTNGDKDVFSKDWPGFRIAVQQDFHHKLPKLEQFLLLEKDSESLLLIPDGDVTEDSEIVTEENFFEREPTMSHPWNKAPWLSFHVFSWHRDFGFFDCRTRLARIRLISLFAANAELADINLALGAETAMELIREVAFTDPPSTQELSALENARELSKKVGALWLLVNDTVNRMQQLYNLCKWAERQEDKEIPPEDSRLRLLCAKYYEQAIRDKRPFALRLTIAEEIGILGRSLRFPRKKLMSNYEVAAKHGAPSRSPLAAKMQIPRYVQSVEDQLRKQVGRRSSIRRSIRLSGGRKKVSPPKWLEHRQGALELEKNLMNRLLDSFKTFEKPHEPKIQHNSLREKVTRNIRETRSILDELQGLIWKAFNMQSGLQGEKIQWYGSLSRTPTWYSVLRCFHADSSPARTNSYALSNVFELSWFKELVLDFLLCRVLLDKLLRIESLLDSNEEIPSQLVTELNNCRNWEPEKFNWWVVFEAVNGIQIRPEQYDIAKDLLLSSENRLAQLNVGLGKSSVILPMLILAAPSNTPVVVNLVPNMFNESCETLARKLACASLPCRLFQQPFSRQYPLEKLPRLHEWKCMWDETPFSVLCTTPEARLSIQLRNEEESLKSSKELSKDLLEKITAPKKKLNIFDECDVLLHYNFQLVYAVGDPNPLPHCRERAGVLATLLGLFDNPSSELKGLLKVDKNFSYKESASKDGRWTETRLLNSSPELRKELRVVLAEGMLVEILQKTKIEDEESLLKYLTEPGFGQLPPCTPSEKALFTAIRGALVGEILFTCLSKRNRIDYGIPRGNFHRAKRDLAVPFRATDLPSERSDFVQPDCLICYTLLAYYHDGLTEKQLESAFQALFKMGRAAQEKEFKTWTQRVPDCEVDNIDQINLDDKVQFEQVLVKYYSHNMATITFWLKETVFLPQTVQFPGFLPKSAWDLVEDESKSIGFAGTNDIQDLFPLTIGEIPSSNGEIAATNAKMLTTFHQVTDENITKLPSNGSGGETVADELIKLARKESCRAIVDAGGLLCGTSSKDVALKILRPDLKVKGVTYYGIDRGAWVVMDQHMRVRLRAESYIDTKDTFVIFDQGRCRGADVKLKSDCKAILTLGVGLTKTELMQSAGRLRGLGKGQTLHLAVAHEVANLLPENFMVKDVVLWTIQNAGHSLNSGLSRWAKHGRNSLLREEIGPHDSLFELEELYGRELEEVEVSTLYQSLQLGNYQEIVRKLGAKVVTFGKGVMVQACSGEDQAEREVEHEVEEEEEQEKEELKKEPELETDFCEADPPTLLTLEEVVTDHTSVQLSINWSSQVLCTSNFLKTVCDTDNFSMFLRAVDMLFVHDTDEGLQVLLISGREAEHLLHAQLADSADSESCHTCHHRLCTDDNWALVNWAVLRQESTYPGMARGDVTLLQRLQQDAELMLSISVFAGEANFPPVLPKDIARKAFGTMAHSTSYYELTEWFDCRSRGREVYKSDIDLS